MTLLIDRLQPHEIGQAARVISAAMITNPNSQALWGGKGERQRHSLEQVTRIVNLEHPKAVNLAVRQDGEIVGALGMTPSPHCQVSFLQGLKLMPRLLLAIRGVMFRAARLQAVGERLDPPYDHWHLGPVGILPQVQGQGIGDMLYQAMCSFLDEQQGAGYLETDRQWIVNSLKDYGFEVLDQASILGVTNWRLWREPA